MRLKSRYIQTSTACEVLAVETTNNEKEKTMNENTIIITSTSANDVPILARLMSKDHLHAAEIATEAENARRLSHSLFYQTNVEYIGQLSRRLAYLETITTWETFEDATTCDYNDLAVCVERALTCTRIRSIDEVLDRRYTFSDERRNVYYAQVLIGLCVIGIASRTIDTADIEPDKWDRRFQSLFIMAFMIAHECACFAKYSAQYTDGQTLASRCTIDAAELKERFERLHMYLSEELAED